MRRVMLGLGLSCCQVGCKSCSGGPCIREVTVSHLGPQVEHSYKFSHLHTHRNVDTWKTGDYFSQSWRSVPSLKKSELHHKWMVACVHTFTAPAHLFLARFCSIWPARSTAQCCSVQRCDLFLSKKLNFRTTPELSLGFLNAHLSGSLHPCIVYQCWCLSVPDQMRFIFFTMVLITLPSCVALWHRVLSDVW